jgi:hypothetical protein
MLTAKKGDISHGIEFALVRLWVEFRRPRITRLWRPRACQMNPSKVTGQIKKGC